MIIYFVKLAAFKQKIIDNNFLKLQKKFAPLSTSVKRNDYLLKAKLNLFYIRRHLAMKKKIIKIQNQNSRQMTPGRCKNHR